MAYLGEDIPKLGFGLMRLPRLEDGQTIDVEQVKVMVDKFLEAGCTYFDTARAYGESENAIRQALVERYSRDRYQLATKNAAWIKAKSAEEAKDDFRISLENTGAGYFDYYLIHNTGDSRTSYFDKYGLWDWVVELKEEGKVKHIGFSHHDNAEELEKIIVAHPQMEFVQLQINYADWENGNVQSRKCVEVAHKHGLPIIVMEPVRGGTLANPPQPVADILQQAAPGRSYADWALRFAMNVEGIITVLSGMSDISQMEQNLQTWKTMAPLSAAETDALQRAQQKLDELLDNPCTSCHYCMKECPMHIDIANTMQALNRQSIYGDPYGKNWYSFCMGRAEVNEASTCIQCGRCEMACPQHIPVISKLQVAAEKFEDA